MAQLDAAETIRAVYQAFNDKDLDRLLSYFHADAKVLNVPFGVTLSVRDYVSNWSNAFPDAYCEVRRVFGSGDRVCAEFIGRGTHQGKMKTPNGELGPTQRRLEMRFCEVFEIRDGKIAGGHAYFDSATMMRQLEIELLPPIGKKPAAQPEARH